MRLLKHLYLLWLDWLVDEAFDKARVTGGESSPYLEDYQEPFAERQRLRKEIAR